MRVVNLENVEKRLGHYLFNTGVKYPANLEMGARLRQHVSRNENQLSEQSFQEFYKAHFIGRNRMNEFYTVIRSQILSDLAENSNAD